MRDLEATKHNLHALSAQEGSPPGTISVDGAAAMIQMRDELIRELKLALEEIGMAGMRSRRAARNATQPGVNSCGG